ncbi:MAG: hypothetical protein P1V35_11530 [Planctomycetota bacterium]|nr:hypothetical protein [Planctomycetota bacterium]
MWTPSAPFLPTLYRTCMWTGLRALYNRGRAMGRVLPECAGPLQGKVVQIRGLGPVRLAVHPRPRLGGEPDTRHFVMLSGQQVSPRLSPWAYRYLLATTHFGCGHLEIGFFVENGEWFFCGARNMGFANALRLDKSWLPATALGDQDSTIAEFTREALQALGALGVRASLSPPEECVRLSVQPRWIPRPQQTRFLRQIHKRYERLHAQLGPTGR